jgi:transcription antitermination factor NusG
MPSKDDKNDLAWYAVHTRSRHERKVASELAGRSFVVFLPEYKTLSRRRDRRKQILTPLFPGYLFVQTRMTTENRIAILQASSVVQIVGISNRPLVVPDHQIESIRIILDSTQAAEPQTVLTSGQLVQVLEGPLKGVIGVVEKAQRKRIIVSVEILGRAVAADLETSAVVAYREN